MPEEHTSPTADPPGSSAAVIRRLVGLADAVAAVAASLQACPGAAVIIQSAQPGQKPSGHVLAYSIVQAVPTPGSPQQRLANYSGLVAQLEHWSATAMQLDDEALRMLDFQLIQARERLAAEMRRRKGTV